jgi:four helix bundle protein
MKSYRELDVWQISMELAEKIHAVSKNFPQDETFGLKSQIRRAAYSVPSNVAEGFGRGHTKEFIQFINTAYGSLCGTETQLTLAVKFKYIPREEAIEIWALTQRIGMMMTKLKKALQKRLMKKPAPQTLSSESRATNHEPR